MAITLHLSVRLIWKEVFTIGQVQEKAIGKKTYTVNEIMELLAIGRSKAYELCNSGCFKIIRVGRVIRIVKSSFDDWLENAD
jgi:excisionase family DNA binding protein